MASAHIDQPLDEQRLRSLSRKRDGGALDTEFYVPAMHCSGCMRKIESGLGALPFVKSARTNLSTQRVHVTWDGDTGQAETLRAEFKKLGFDATVFQLSDLDQADTTRNDLLMCLGVAGFAAANIMLLSVSVWSGADGPTRQLFHLISGLIAIPAVAYAGRPFYTSAIKALRSGQLNMDVPISLAILLATAMSIHESLTDGKDAYFDAATMLLFFLLIGRTLDHIMRARARGAVKALAGLAAKGGIVLAPDGTQSFVNLRDIKPGDHLLVPAGERIPVDSVVIGGTSDIDRSLVTGESAPLAATVDTPIEAGAINLSNPIELRATRTEDTSFLAEVVRLMEAAEHGKARFVQIADRAARIYAPAVHLLALATFIGWIFSTHGDWHTAASTAIAVLIITCPCALGLAVPIVHVIGAGRLFERGVMLKDGAALERLREVDTVIFDKTGTLTLGHPKITSTNASSKLGALAATVASTSVHPMAKSVAAFVADGGSEPLTSYSDKPEHIRDVAGSGIEARVNQRRIRLGRRAWVEEIARIPTEDAQSASRRASTVWIGMEGETAAHFALQDPLRPDAAQVICQLQRDGLSTQILSGDAPGPVRSVAKSLKIETAASEQKPQDKINRIVALQQDGHKVLMVGDGINDAPALAAADVSMAPSSGSDIGRQCADLVFTHASLDCIPFARRISVRADRLVKQNIGIAVIYNCIAVPFAVAGYVTPLFAALAMSASSILVVANSLRLRYGDTKPQRRLGSKTPRPANATGGVALGTPPHGAHAR